MFNEALYLAISIFISISAAQLLSRLLFEKKIYRNINLLLLSILFLKILYNVNPTPFLKSIFFLLSFRLEYLMTFLIVFLPFIIPTAILFSRGDTWLLSEIVVRLIKGRRTRFVLNLITIFAITLSLLSVVSINPVTTIYKIPINLSYNQNIGILLYREYKWIGSVTGTESYEDYINIDYEMRTIFLTLFKNPIIFEEIEVTCNDRKLILGIVSHNDIEKIPYITLQKKINSSNKNILVNANKSIFNQGSSVYIKELKSTYIVDGKFTFHPILKKYNITPDILLFRESISQEEVLNLISQYNGKAIIVIYNDSIDENLILTYIKMFRLEEESGGKAVIRTPYIYMLNKEGGMLYYTLGTYFLPAGFTGYIIVSIIILSLTLFSTMLGTIYERRREYTTMSCLGASPKAVSLLLLLEGIYIASLGGLITIIFANYFISRGLSFIEIKSNLSSIFLISLIPIYTSTILAYIAIKFKSIKEIIPGGEERISVKKIYNGVTVNIPIKIRNTKSFISFLKESVKKREAIPGLKITGLEIQDSKIIVDTAYGVERETPYLLILKVEEKYVSVKIFGKYAWTAEHVRDFEEFFISLRKFLLLYKTK